MVKKLLVALLVFLGGAAHAETIKTDVVVIGNGTAAIAAAIQSGRSNVKTLLLLNGPWLEELSLQKMTALNDPTYAPSGIWEELDKELRQFYKKTSGYDTLAKALMFEPYAAAGALKRMADSTKQLTAKLNVIYNSIEKDGTGWKLEVMIKGEKVTIKAKVLIDGTEDGEMIKKAGATLPPDIITWLSKGAADLYRTSIASGTYLTADKQGAINYPGGAVYYIPLSAVTIKGVDNLLTINKTLFPNGAYNLTAKIAVGQGVGATAAYCAFFKTTTQKLDPRVIQIEILDFKSSLLYFTDVDRKDPYYRAVQQIAATGLLKGYYIVPDSENPNGDFHFMPELEVRTAEIKPILTEIYSRVFLWMNREKPGEQFTVGNLLSLISEITLAEPADFKLKVQKAWKTEYKFKSDFDLNKPVTRREFAILANQYLSPFARKVDINGKVLN
ncbi:FAD-dependent oxidoreductase [Mucilaginibacter auburnensis]|uniref:S-layer family protein n=1 Tax=Mucilaginibacter auburnensis TaxID=1457233 RepID=A0A2H9VN56_9SPHI|nr:FAD-dependent oxidoreductase [Mucilaginibacter auburnensis]PJJ79758.1 S-layer family protein [Mucilaginibacter auburnensis]